MLDLTRLTVTYGDLRAVDDVDLAVPDGSVTAVLGPSGCGKSTLLRAVAGLEPVRPGMVAWDGADQAAVPPHRRGFALMFQDGQLFDHLTVERNVGYALRIRKVDRAAARERVAGLLDLVGLAGQGGRLPRQLSGGERQRVALARALAAEPRLLLLDEPLSALDAELRERLAGDLGRILRAAGTTALMVTHDQAEAFAVADRLAVMRAGRLVQAGPTAEVWSAPADAATARFLGYAAVVDGPGAALLGRTAGLPDAPAVAVRRAAVRVVGPAPADDVAAPGTLAGRVASVVPTPDAGHVEVDVEGVGPLPALAPLSRLPRTGERVAIEVDRALLAALVHP